jgi:hypothetical protein
VTARFCESLHYAGDRDGDRYVIAFTIRDGRSSPMGEAMSKKLAVGARKQKVKGPSTPKRVLAGAGKRVVTGTPRAPEWSRKKA